MSMITQDELETLIKFKAPVHIVDVRKQPAVEKNPAKIQGAVWQDFQNVKAWADSVNDGLPVVCYCVHGHEVSQSATAELRSAGISASYLRGGFEAWQQRSGPLAL
ncbi:rhodanese-like domain-containing protein [Thalassospiraceae bacterium LMO-JJ14]|nr:rhodanese-like domain-containing protein [Thalassospiraceae bacterium LMO-JJ14]